MTISLTCACGVRLEIDDSFAGQTVNCPDCQRPLATARPEPAGIQTSGFALASLILALVGAFTLVGTVLAIVFGTLALRDLARRPEQVAGRRYALAGIGLGVLLTALTGFLLISGEWLGLSNLAARVQWSGKLDYGGPEEVVRPREGFAFKRPSPRWGLKRAEREAEDAHIWDEPLLVNVDEDAYLLCYAEPNVEATDSVDRCLENVLKQFAEQDRGGIFGGKTSTGHRSRLEEGLRKHLPPIGTSEIIEVRVDKRLLGQNRRFLIRVIKAPGEGTAYVLIGGARRSHFDRAAPDLRKAMDSFRRVDEDRPPG